MGNSWTIDRETFPIVCNNLVIAWPALFMKRNNLWRKKFLMCESIIGKKMFYERYVTSPKTFSCCFKAIHFWSINTLQSVMDRQRTYARNTFFFGEDLPESNWAVCRDWVACLHKVMCNVGESITVTQWLRMVNKLRLRIVKTNFILLARLLTLKGLMNKQKSVKVSRTCYMLTIKANTGNSICNQW